MSDINVDPDSLERLASQIQQEVETIRNQIRTALDSVTSLSDQWRDVRYKQFEAQATEGMAMLLQVVDTLSDMEVFLRQRAQAVRDYLNGN
jgi:uncharacterized protein YukE